ncbi:MAG: NAD-dependent deacylase [Chitinophagaceae bacterium]|nr:NAD-dependent deacylase [Chitinophagaceae bacterium]
MQKVIVFTGAGISAESGLQTFRDQNGLWQGYRVEDVATPSAFKKNPELVLDFYNQRRRNVKEAQPNAAHVALAALEQRIEVEIITQNIDDLHERAGSSKVLHLHGEIFKMRSALREDLVYPIYNDILVGDLAEDGAQLRPHIVWFEEPVPLFEQAIQQVQDADAFVVIGTSLVVYPAASILNYLPPFMPVYVLDKKVPKISRERVTYIEQSATEGINELIRMLLPA